MTETGKVVTDQDELNEAKSRFEQRLELAGRWDVIRCALVMSAIVGTILVAINHGYCVCMGRFNTLCLLQSLLTYFVPYSVSTISSVLAIERGCK